MWVSDRHPNRDELLRPPAPRQAPTPSGVELLAIDRPGRGRADQVLRLSLDEFRGSKFLAVRIWEVGPDGSTWPTKAGCSIRLAEAEDVAAAILEGLRLAHVVPARPPATPSSPGRREPPRQGRAARPPVDRGRQGGPSLWQPDGPVPPVDCEFDEFASS